jgi:hypothetical protein
MIKALVVGDIVKKLSEAICDHVLGANMLKLYIAIADLRQIPMVSQLASVQEVGLSVVTTRTNTSRSIWLLSTSESAL